MAWVPARFTESPMGRLAWWPQGEPNRENTVTQTTAWSGKLGLQR